MAKPPLILASASAVRASLLKGAGLDFEVADSRLDEEEVKRGFAGRDDAADTDALALKLAAEKARAVSRGNPQALVIGADQILSCEGKRYDKPKSMAEARANLLAFRGRPHILHSGVALVANDVVVWSHAGQAHLTMRDFTDDFLDEYLALAGERVLKSVGCYQLEGPGVQLFERIEGDYFTILGLPLLPLLDELRARGAVLK
ncbi:MAG: septum formation protein Maf [Alphaproteobacteria bacterium HGW-Alphaproteobacteria-11]|nr:MAG: septum formation protein Maf [Alphaproteobacteria bacterium HGW-Alphaproteobacteria-11]